MLFTKEDFKESWLNYSDEFIISEKSSIYFGPNGIGKTTTYRVMKEKHPLLGFFSYDDCKEKILKEKNKLKISIRTTDIEKLKIEKQELIDSLELKTKAFKIHDITSSTKASDYSDYCKEAYNENEKALLGFASTGLEVLLEYKYEIKKKFILTTPRIIKFLF